MKCLIVGSSGSIGNYLKNYFSYVKGFKVVTLDREKNKRETKKSFYCNLNSNVELKKKINKIFNLYGYIDLFISCIGHEGSITKKITDIKIKSWKKNFNVNLFSNVMIISNILPIIRSGSLIFFSGGGTTTYPHGIKKNLIEYSCSKIALIKFVEIISAHLSKNKINANILAPGPIKSKMLKNIYIKGKNFLGSDRKEIYKILNSKNNLSHISNSIEFLIQNKQISGKIISTKHDNLKKILMKNNNKDYFTIRIKK